MPCPSLAEIEQTLFLGCSVERFSCSLGWNEQVSTLDVTLVRDKCSPPVGSPKVYYDVTSFPNVKKTWTGPDPGFKSFGINGNEYPKLGAPVYFRFGDFEFCGILQDWQKSAPQSDQDVYTVKIVSPLELLSGCELILDSYVGPVKGFNIFNVFGFLERFGTAAPAYVDPRYPQDGTLMGSDAGGFGGSGINEDGIPWWKVKQGVHALTSNFFRISDFGYANFSEYGRVVGKGSNENPRFGLLPSDYTNIELGSTFGISNNVCFYLLDLTELPATADDIRISGNMSVLELITEVTASLGYDYYVELVPVFVAGALYKYIKLRTISRNKPANIGVVANYVENVAEVIDSSYGREFRNDSTTTFLIGGKKRNIWQVESGLPPKLTDPEEAYIQRHYGNNTWARQRIKTFYGPYANDFLIGGALLVENNDANGEFINVDIRRVKNELRVLGPLLNDVIKIYKNEILAAYGGYEHWLNFAALTSSALFTQINSGGVLFPSIFNTEILKNGLLNDEPVSRDLLKLNKSNDFAVQDLHRDFEILHNFLSDIGNNYINRFAVRLPYVKFRIKDNYIQALLSGEFEHLESTDSIAREGWTEASNVLGFANPPQFKYFPPFDVSEFKDFGLGIFMNPQNGLIWPFAIWDYDNGASTEGAINVLPELYYLYPTQTDTSVYGQMLVPEGVHAVCEYPDQSFYSDIFELDRVFGGFDLSRENFAALIMSPGKTKRMLRKDIERDLLAFHVGMEKRLPDRVCIATQSNLNSYGPWKPNNVIEGGPPGQIRLEQNDALVPWNFGGFNALNTVATARANVGVTVMDEAESGYIRVAGIPNVPLGAELASIQGLQNQYYNNNEQLFEHRTTAVTTFDLLDGPNSTSVAFVHYYVDYKTWDGTFGPQVNNISYSVGQGEVSTTYNFTTFTPKFGILSKLNADRISKRLENRALHRRLNVITRAVNENVARTQNLRESLKVEAFQDPQWRGLGKSPHPLLIGSVIPWSGASGGTGTDFKRNIINTKSIQEAQHDLNASGDFAKIAMMSWDGLIRPVSMDGDGDLPRYVTPSGDGSDLSLSRGAHPIFTGYESYKQVINTDYLNPFSNPTSKKRSSINDRHEGDQGHDIDIIARGTLDDFDQGGDSLIMPSDSGGYADASRADYYDDYRMLALRGPMLLHGWGYDTDGKPIPNAADVEEDAVAGKFVKNNLKDKFMTDFMRKSHTWPVAPIDLRYDRSRGVWTSSQPRRQLCALLKTPVMPLDSGYAEVLDGQSYFDSDGNPITNKIIVVKDCINQNYASGIRVVVDYDEYGQAYNIVNAPASGTQASESVIPFKFITCMPVNGPGSGVRIIEDEDGNEVTTGEPFRLQSLHSNMWGPCPSGYKGWASTIGLDITGTGISAPLNYAIINCETLPEFIEFQAESGFPNDTVDGYVVNSWNGGPLQNEYVKVTLPSYIDSSTAFIQGSLNIGGTAVINRNRIASDANNTGNGLCNPQYYYYDVIDIFGISASGSDNIASPTAFNQPEPGDRFGIIEWGKGLDIQKINAHQLRVSATGSGGVTVFPFKLTKCMPVNGFGTGRRITIDDDDNEVEFGDEIYLQCIHDNMWGPCPSGYRGWAVDNGTIVTGTGVTDPDMSYGIINIETLPEYIEFQAESGFPVNTVDGYVINSWNGGVLQNEYVKVTLPTYIGTNAFIQGTENVFGTAVLNRNRTLAEATGCGNYADYYYDVIDIFGIACTGSNNISTPTAFNQPLPGDRFGIIEWGKGLNLQKINAHQIRVSATGAGAGVSVFPFKLTQCMPVNGYGIGKRITIDDDDNEVEIGDPIYLQCIHDNIWGPCPSGYRGWAVDNGTIVTGTGVTDPDISYGIINIETLPEYIEFQAESGFPDATVDAFVTNSWNGGILYHEYVKVTLPTYIGTNAFIQGTENIFGTAVINRNRTLSEATGCGGPADYYYDVIDIFGISISGSTEKVDPFNQTEPLVNDRYSILEFGRGLYLDRINYHTMRIGAGIGITGTNAIANNVDKPSVRDRFTTLEFGAGLNVQKIDEFQCRVSSTGLSNVIPVFGVTKTEASAASYGSCITPGTATVAVYTGNASQYCFFQNQTWYNLGNETLPSGTPSWGTIKEDGNTYFLSQWCATTGG